MTTIEKAYSDCNKACEKLTSMYINRTCTPYDADKVLNETYLKIREYAPIKKEAVSRLVVSRAKRNWEIYIESVA